MHPFDRNADHVGYVSRKNDIFGNFPGPIKYARSGGLKVDDIWTDAPDWLKAAKKSSKLERKGSVQSRGFALPRNFATQLVPLNSFATAFPFCRSDCVIGNTSLGRRPVGSQFAAFAPLGRRHRRSGQS